MSNRTADCASRGTLVKTLIQSSLWWYGPDWLSKPESAWPPPPTLLTAENLKDIDSEKKQKC